MIDFRRGSRRGSVRTLGEGETPAKDTAMASELYARPCRPRSFASGHGPGFRVQKTIYW